MTFVGELGWEIYCPTEYGAGLWRTLWEAGREHGLIAGGYRAIDSMRLEKGYRVWAADITPDETPYESGLGFCVKDDGGFIGAAALGVGGSGKPEQPPRRLRCLVLERPTLGRARQRAGAGRRRGDRPRHERRLRLHGGALDRLRLPARARSSSARRSRSTSSAGGSRATLASEPLFDPKGERVRG